MGTDWCTVREASTRFSRGSPDSRTNGPERESPQTRPDYKLSDKREQWELISWPCHRGSAPRGPFCMSMMPHALRCARDTCLRLWLACGLHRPPALYTCDCLQWGLRHGDNTGGLFILFSIRASYSIGAPACWHFNFGHCKGFAPGTAKIILTGAPGAPGGPKIAPPLWKGILY